MASTQPASAPHDNRLRSHAIGVAGIVFFVVAAAAPLAATLGLTPITFGVGGVGAPLAYVIAAAILLLFATGYASMSRHVTSSAGFAAFIEQGLGRVAGFAAATTAVVAYNAMLLGIYGALGFFAEAEISRLFGIDLAWWVWAFIAIALVAVFGYLDVNLSARVLGLLLIGEIALLVLFDLVVPARGGQDGISFEYFMPDNLFSSGALGLTILFAASSFVGFEATAIYGEEARDPRRTVPRATYISVILIGLIYAWSAWAIGLAHGVDDVQDAALADPANFVFGMNTEYVGAWSTEIMGVLVVTSYFATVLAFHNTIARYMYSLGRGGVLPRQLGVTHEKHRSPYVASALCTLLSVVVVGGFAVSGADPFAQQFAWLTGLGAIGILALQAATAVAAVIFFRRRLRAGNEAGNLWTTLVAPLLGAAGLLAIIVLAVRNWDLLSGATSGLAAQLPWVLVLAAAVGVLLAFVKRDTVKSVSDSFGDHPPVAADAMLSGAVAPEPDQPDVPRS
jgi:amino acid transporter